MEVEWLEQHVKHLQEDENQFRSLVDHAAHHIKNSIEQVLLALVRPTVGRQCYVPSSGTPGHGYGGRGSALFAYSS